MTLVMSFLAAIICSVVWYVSDKAKQLHVGSLCYMFWGASIMWMVDAVFEYSELRLSYFETLLSSVGDDAFLGLLVIVLALFIWVSILFIKDPYNKLRNKQEIL